MKIQCLQGKGVDYSYGYIRAFVWDLKVPKVSNGVPTSPFSEGLSLESFILDS
jgi:hypothetical protein